jgi:hypothetical protein
MECKFSVGDRVVVEAYGAYVGLAAPLVIITSSEIAKVFVKKVVLKNGEEWCADGNRPWGLKHEPYYRGGLLRLRTKEDDSTIRRQNCLHRIERANWQAMSNDVLAAVDSLIKQAQPQKETKS